MNLSMYQWFGVGLFGFWLIMFLVEHAAGVKSIFRNLWWFFVVLGGALIWLGK